MYYLKNISERYNSVLCLTLSYKDNVASQIIIEVAHLCSEMLLSKTMFLLTVHFPLKYQILACLTQILNEYSSAIHAN